jgi:hypothetical protein
MKKRRCPLSHKKIGGIGKSTDAAEISSCAALF